MNTDTREYQKVIDYLYQLIEDGSLTIGSRLPTERNISETLSIGRNSTREALRTLGNLGIIESRRGSGNYLVSNISDTIAQSVDMMLLMRQITADDISSFRRSMEKAACSSIIENHNLGKWHSQISDTLTRSMKATSIDEQVDLDRQFHFLLIHATENPLWISLLEAVTNIYRRRIDQVLHNAGEELKTQLYQAHLSILKALELGDRQLCEEAIDLHYNLLDTRVRGK